MLIPFFTCLYCFIFFFFFFQAEDGIRDADVTGVQTCALPISRHSRRTCFLPGGNRRTAAAGLFPWNRRFSRRTTFSGGLGGTLRLTCGCLFLPAGSRRRCGLFLFGLAVSGCGGFFLLGRPFSADRRLFFCGFWLPARSLLTFYLHISFFPYPGFPGRNRLFRGDGCFFDRSLFFFLFFRNCRFFLFLNPSTKGLTNLIQIIIIHRTHMVLNPGSQFI